MDDIKDILKSIYNKGITIEEINDYYNQQEEAKKVKKQQEKIEKEKYKKYIQDCETYRKEYITALKNYINIITPDADINFADFKKNLIELEKAAYKGNVKIKFDVQDINDDILTSLQTWKDMLLGY